MIRIVHDIFGLAMSFVFYIWKMLSFLIHQRNAVVILSYGRYCCCFDVVPVVADLVIIADCCAAFVAIFVVVLSTNTGYVPCDEQLHPCFQYHPCCSSAVICF